MEGEDIEGLLEYHGFSLKQFEDLYMVKEAPFLNGDIDFPTKRSQLVHQKRSAKVVNDVISPGQVPIMDGTLYTIKTLGAEADKLSNRAKGYDGPAFISTVPPEEEMPDYEEDALPNDDVKVKDWEMQEPFGSHQTKKVEEADKFEIRSPMPNFGGEPVIPRSGAGKHTIHWSNLLQEQQVKKKCRNVPELDVKINKRFFPLKEHFESVVEREEVARPLVHATNEMHGTETVKDWIVVEANHQEERAKLAMWKAEAYNAKLKVLLRRWKRQASKNAESRHIRRLKANAALNSILVGPPVRSNKGIACQEELAGCIHNLSMVELNIDQILKERHNRHTRMWSKLDVSEVIFPILSQKNPQAVCLCWKLVLCSRTDDDSCTRSSHIVGQWLRTKLMGSNKMDRELSTVSISEVATSGHSGTDRLFCLYILRDLAFNVDSPENEGASLGASGLLFLLVDNVQWDFERTRLQSLVRSVKPGSCLPLLILSSVNVEGSTIENQLELHKLDTMRISSWSVIPVTENAHNNNAKGFLNDDCLRNGLLWLADHAPPQPNVYPSDVRNLVLESLEPYLNILLNAKPSEVTASYCIRAFNQALNETESDIILAAQNSLPGWLAPEIKDLDVRIGGGFLDSYLPKSGWNIGCNIEAIVHVLRLCRLPELSSFNLDPVFCGVDSQKFSSWNLHSETNKLDEIQEQKTTLQKCLYQYLCEISFAKEGDLMTLKEADLMVQKHTVCVCTDSRYAIVPEWATIFRRIYNWRLMLLESEPAPIVYVFRPRKIGLLVNELKQHLLSSVRQIFMTSGNAYQVAPSLNETVESSCRVISRAPRLEDNGKTVKDQYQQHAKGASPEHMVKNGFIDFAKSSCSQNTFASGQNRLMGVFEPAEHIAEEVEFQILDSEEVWHTIEFGQTDGELKLNQAVTEFCEKVNDQKRRTALLMEGANVTDCSRTANPAARLCIAEKEKSAYEEIRRSESCEFERLASEAIDCRRAAPSSTWATSSATDKLSNLLEQCSAVQSNIEKKLVGYFG